MPQGVPNSLDGGRDVSPDRLGAGFRKDSRTPSRSVWDNYGFEMEERRPLETLSWFVIAATTVVVVLVGAAMGFSVARASLMRPLGAIGLLMVIGWIYRYRRPDIRIATAMTGVAQLIAFSSIGAVLSYLVAANQRPLWDAAFMAWDRALGLDWLAYLAFVDARPNLGWWLGIAYVSIMPQFIVVIATLALTGRIATCRTFIATFIVCALVVILISGVMPALSVISHLGLKAQDFEHLRPSAAYSHVPDSHLADYLGLRDGTLRILAIDRLEGIITFPSLHASLAAILCVALWQVPWLRWVGVAVNAMMLAATPIYGGHYFVDVFAGLAAAGASYLFVRRVGRPARPDVTLATGASFAATSA